MTVQIGLGWVRVYTVDPPISVIARLSEEKPTVEQGYGGWEEVTRPRRSPITTFKAPPGLHLTLPLLLNEWRQGTSVEDHIRKLERMAWATAANGDPPKVKLRAKGGHIPFQGRRWLIDTLTWGEALMNKSGNRVRQQVTLSLMEYVEDVHLQEKSAANRVRAKAKAAKTKQGASHKRVVTKRSGRAAHPAGRTLRAGQTDFGQGEDLLTIAARELGDADRWVEIAQLNGLRDPRAIPPGLTIRLP